MQQRRELCQLTLLDARNRKSLKVSFLTKVKAKRTDCSYSGVRLTLLKRVTRGYRCVIAVPTRQG